MHAELIMPSCLRRFLSSQASCDFSVLDFLKILEYRPPTPLRSSLQFSGQLRSWGPPPGLLYFILGSAKPLSWN